MPVTLSDLQARFFPSGVGTGGDFNEDSLAEPIIDGVEYFGRMFASMNATSGPDDAILIVTWEFNPDWDLRGNQPPQTTLGQLVADKAALGVDVRIVINGSVGYRWKRPAFAIFARNFRAAKRLRAWRPSGGAGAPLANRVLFDFCGAEISGSQHQKAIIVRSAGELVAYVGGMNMDPNQRDECTAAHPHTEKAYEDGTPWGWHDVGMRLTGAAVAGVWANFRDRWTEAATLPQHCEFQLDEFEDVGPDGVRWGQHVKPVPQLNPPPQTIPAIGPAPADPNPALSTSQRVRVARSRFKVKQQMPPLPWTTEPTNAPLTEIYFVLKQAILEAERYIYLEDQFLDDQPSAKWVESIPGEYSLFQTLAAAMAANPSLKVILVGSGLADPGDPVWLRGDGKKNRVLTDSIEKKLLANLPPTLTPNLAVWRVEGATVHAKLVMIDDHFLSIGSANFQSRSMYGLDSELQVMMVGADSTIPTFRATLWREHLRQFTPSPDASAALQNLDKALGIWREGWYQTDPTLWFLSGNPAGVNGHGALAFVGPEYP